MQCKLWLLVTSGLLFLAAAVSAQQPQTVWSDQEKPIMDQMKGLRSLSDSERAAVTSRLAIQIRQLPSTAKKEPLADSLANLATEGDPGHDTLQEVATTLAQALAEQPVPPDKDQPAMPYITLAQLVRYEHVEVSLNNPQFTAAMKHLEANERQRQNADFTLRDLNGVKWSLKDLRGKVVLVNFWATWCPPCRKEMPDLEALYQEFGPRGLVILAISDEEAGKVKPFVAEHKFTFPILLDPGRKVNDLLHVEGIPKSFVYDRSGKLVAQAMDMRTKKQFLAMLAQAGLEASAAPSDLALALRYDNSHALFLTSADISNVSDLPKGAQLPAPAASFIQSRPWFDIDSAQLDKLRLDPPLNIHVGDQYELMPGPVASLVATVEKFVLLDDNCGRALWAMLRVAPKDLPAFARLGSQEYLARPARAGGSVESPAGVPIAQPNKLRLSPAERPHFEEVITKAMRNYLGKLDYTAAPPETARAWRALAAGQTGAQFSYDVETVPLGPKYGRRYYARAMWVVPGAPQFVFGLWLRPGANPAVETIWPVGELQAFDNLEDARNLDSVPNIANVFLMSDGTVRVLQLSFGHETADLWLLEYVNGEFKETGIVLAAADC